MSRIFCIVIVACHCVLLLTTQSEAATFTVGWPDGTRLGLPLESNHALSAPNHNADTAIIGIHGSNQIAAETYGLLCQALQAETGLTGCPSNRVMIFAPEFNTDNAPGNLYWGYSNWKRGYNSREVPGHPNARITSFGVVDLIVEKLLDSTKFSNLKKIVIIGHSAGGQFTQRYAAANKVQQTANAAGVAMRYIPVNPAMYLYFDNYRPDLGGSPSGYEADTFLPYTHVSTSCSVATDQCPGRDSLSCCECFNDYGEGLEHTEDTYLEENNVGDDAIRSQYANRRVIMLIGENDDYDNNVDCKGYVQGATRLQRALSFYSYIGDSHWPSSAAPLGRDSVYNKHRLFVIPSIGHDEEGMFTSQVARRFLFNRGNTRVNIRGIRPVPFDTSRSSDSRVTFQWFGIPGATMYRVIVNLSSGTRLSISVPPQRANCQHGGLCSFEPARTISGAGTWTLSAHADGGWSGRAPVENFS